MKVRIILPSKNGGKPRYDDTVEMPEVPLPGETVGVQPKDDENARGERCALYWVEYRRWYLNSRDDKGVLHETQVACEVWLTENMDMGRMVESVSLGDLRRELERLPQARPW